MREQMAEKMSRVPMGVIVDTPTGTFKNRFVDNVNQLEDAIAHFMPELPSNVFAPILAMTIVFAVDWRMGLAGIATIPLGVLFYLGMMRDYKPKMARYIKSEQDMNSTLVEYVNGIQVIKAFGARSSSYGSFSDAVGGIPRLRRLRGSGRAGCGWRRVARSCRARCSFRCRLACGCCPSGRLRFPPSWCASSFRLGVHRWRFEVRPGGRPDLAYGCLPERGLGFPR